MKKQFTYLLFFVILSILLLTQGAKSVDPLYVVFDNLDIITNTEGTVISNAFDQLYYDPIKSHYGDYLVKLPFSDATFAQYDVTKFDLAVFPMGDTPLSFTTPGGISVLSKIKQMEAAGKRVILVGRTLLSQQNGAIEDFFYNYLGVDEWFTISPLLSGGYYVRYTINGVVDDSVANGARKWANFSRGENGIPPEPPWRCVSQLESFHIRKDDPRFIKIDWFSKVTDDFIIINYPPTDSCMGVRAYTPHSKMVFWCYGGEFLCAVGSISRHCTELWIAMQWLLYDIPKIGPNLTVAPNPIQFGGVQIGTDIVRRTVITNYGRQPLIVNDVYIVGYEDPTPFDVIGPFQFTVPPLDTHSVFVRFSPTEERAYIDALSFESNSGGHSSTIDMDVKGVGGKDAEQGPIIDVVSFVDFGEIKIGSRSTLPIIIKNIGTAPLIINYNDFVYGEGPFTYELREAGMQINKDSSYTMKIRYVPAIPCQVDSAMIKIETNQKGENPFTYIKLKGKAACLSPKILIGIISVNFDTVVVGENRDMNILIRNTGSADLVIDSINFTQNDSSAWSFVNGSGDVPRTILPSESHELIVRLTPVDSTLHQATIVIKSNSSVDSVYTIKFSGVGKKLQDTVAVKDYSIAENELFRMKSMPNPSNGKALLEYKLKGFEPKSVEIFIVDLLGNRISTLVNSKLTPGDYNMYMDLTTTKIVSGNYFIIANVGGTQARLPIVILK